MTALAMIIGMIPMALGLGEGAEQNAPLGRAVIGGLIFRHRVHIVFRARVYAGVHSGWRARKARRAPRSAPPA
jgi:multidrug efflux pump subunit AcrB